MGIGDWKVWMVGWIIEGVGGAGYWGGMMGRWE